MYYVSNWTRITTFDHAFADMMDRYMLSSLRPAPPPLQLTVNIPPEYRTKPPPPILMLEDGTDIPMPVPAPPKQNTIPRSPPTPKEPVMYPSQHEDSDDGSSYYTDSSPSSYYTDSSSSRAPPMIPVPPTKPLLPLPAPNPSPVKAALPPPVKAQPRIQHVPVKAAPVKSPPPRGELQITLPVQGLDTQQLAKAMSQLI
jgi:hypothetical protein